MDCIQNGTVLHSMLTLTIKKVPEELYERLKEPEALNREIGKRFDPELIERGEREGRT